MNERAATKHLLFRLGSFLPLCLFIAIYEIVIHDGLKAGIAVALLNRTSI